jgi:hypothetical protein
MSLREELQNRADKLDAELLALSGRIRAIERESDDVHTCINALDIAEMDAQDAALGYPSPIRHKPARPSIDHTEPESGLRAAEDVWTPEGLEQLSAKADAFIAHIGAPQIEPEPSLFDDTNFDDEDDAPSEFISDLTGDPAIEPETGLHGEPEPTELDAPASIVDDPELLAAVARAEATLQEAEPAYVGLQDPDLDAEYDAMKERERADRKLHFSIFGMKREDA